MHTVMIVVPDFLTPEDAVSHIRNEIRKLGLPADLYPIEALALDATAFSFTYHPSRSDVQVIINRPI
jgi:hypothetical protein